MFAHYLLSSFPTSIPLLEILIVGGLFFYYYFFKIVGLGMVTPLGCGVEATWKSLIEGGCGIRAITPEDIKMTSFDRETQLQTFDQLTSKVAAFVPCGANPGEFNEDLWLNSKVNFSCNILH